MARFHVCRTRNGAVGRCVRLNLAWNGLGERGAEAIGEVLKENKTLQFLDLSSNRIEKGTESLAQGLMHNQTLRSLQLNGNPIGDRGVMLLIDAVGENNSLRDLGLQALLHLCRQLLERALH